MAALQTRTPRSQEPDAPRASLSAQHVTLSPWPPCVASTAPEAESQTRAVRSRDPVTRRPSPPSANAQP